MADQIVGVFVAHEPEPSQNWLVEALKRARTESALPFYAGAMAAATGRDVEDVLDAIEIALKPLAGEITEESARGALRAVAEPYAGAIGVEWSAVADAILGTLEWSAPDPSTWALDGWNDARRKG